MARVQPLTRANTNARPLCSVPQAPVATPSPVSAGPPALDPATDAGSSLDLLLPNAVGVRQCEVAAGSHPSRLESSSSSSTSHSPVDEAVDHRSILGHRLLARATDPRSVENATKSPRPGAQSGLTWPPWEGNWSFEYDDTQRPPTREACQLAPSAEDLAAQTHIASASANAAEIARLAYVNAQLDRVGLQLPRHRSTRSVPAADGTARYCLDTALQHTLSEYVRRARPTLPAFVEKWRHQTQEDYRQQGTRSHGPS